MLWIAPGKQLVFCQWGRTLNWTGLPRRAACLSCWYSRLRRRGQWSRCLLRADWLIGMGQDRGVREVWLGEGYQLWGGSVKWYRMEFRKLWRRKESRGSCIREVSSIKCYCQYLVLDNNSQYSVGNPGRMIVKCPVTCVSQIVCDNICFLMFLGKIGWLTY